MSEEVVIFDEKTTDKNNVTLLLCEENDPIWFCSLKYITETDGEINETIVNLRTSEYEQILENMVKFYCASNPTTNT